MGFVRLLPFTAISKQGKRKGRLDDVCFDVELAVKADMGG
jgi:hypothetical protein